LKERLQYFYDKGYYLPNNIEFSLQILLGTFKQAAYWWLKNQETLTKTAAIKEMTGFLEWFFNV